MSELNVRPAHDSDAAAIARLGEQLRYPASQAEVRERLLGVASAPDAGVFVAELEGHGVAGLVHIALLRLLVEPTEALIVGLVVETDLRGRGIGTALLRRAEEWAAGHGCTSLRVRTRVERKDAHRFYESRGFQLVKTQRVYRKPLDGVDRRPRGGGLD